MIVKQSYPCHVITALEGLKALIVIVKVLTDMYCVGEGKRGLKSLKCNLLKELAAETRHTCKNYESIDFRTRMMVDKNIDEQTTKILTICFVCLLCSLVDDENHEDLMSRSIKNNIGHTS